MAYSVKDKLKQSYTRLVKPAQNYLQQAQLAKIAYNREQASGGVGRRLMANPITYAGGAMTNELYKVGKQGLSSAKNLLPGGTPAKPTDAYNVINAVAAPFTTIPKFLVGGGINIGMQGVSNKMKGNSFINKNTWGETFAQGASKAPFYTALSAINPLSTIKPQTTGPLLSRMAQNVTTGAIREGLIEGPIEGAIRPLQQGETRWKAIANDMIYGSLFGAGTEIGGEAARLGKGMVKVVGDKIQIDPSKFVRVKGDTSPVWDDKTKRYRVNGQFYKKMKEQIDFLNERKPIQVMRGGQLVTEIQPRWRDQSGFIKPDEFVSKGNPNQKTLSTTPQLNPSMQPLTHTALSSLENQQSSLPKNSGVQTLQSMQQRQLKGQTFNDSIPSQNPRERIGHLLNYATQLRSLGYNDDQIKQISAPEAKRIFDNSIPPFSHPTFTGKTQQTGNLPLPKSLPRNSYQAQTKALSGLPSQPQTAIVQKTTPKIQLPPEKEALIGFRSAPRHEYTTPNGKVNALDYLRTPDRVLSKLGLGKEAELLRKKELDYKQDLPKELDTVNKWWNEIGNNEQSSTNIFKYLDGQKQVKLNPTELKVAKEMRTYLSNWADKLQLPEDKRITHYITHIFEKDLINKDFDPELAKLIRDKVPGSVYDPFLEQRLGKKGYVEDAFRAVDAYVKRATRKYHMDQALGELQNKAGRTLEESPLDAKSWEYVKEYVDRVNLRPTKIDELFDQLVKDSPIGYKLGDRPMAEVSRKMRRMVYRGTLGLNPRTALKNLTQGANTYAELGEKYTTIGYAKTMRSLFGGDDELKRVGVLDNAMVQDRNLSAKKRVIERFDNGLFALFNLAEKVNRGAAYYGAKQRALSQGKPLNQAIQEGIDIARKTQFTFGQVDTPVALQSDVAKTLLQFQSFSLKQGEYLGEKLKNKEFAGLIRWAGANVLIITAFGELLGMDIKDLIPSVKVGGSPIFGLGSAVKDAAMDNPDQYNNERDAFDHAKNIGSKLVPFVPGGVAIKRAFEGVGAVNQGASKTKGGKTRFEIEQTPSNYVKAAALGQYSLPGSKEYFNKDKSKEDGGSLLDRIGEVIKPGSKASAEDGKITIPRDPEEAKIFYKQALQEINNAKGNRIKYTYDSSLTEDERKKKLDTEMEKNVRAVNTINQMRKQNPEQVFGYELESHATGGSKTTEQRAKWVHQTLKTAKSDKELSDLLRKLYQGKVLTQSVAEMLNEEYGLNLTHYMSGDKLKSLGGSGKKGKKTISDAQILSSYRKTLEAYAKPRARYKSFSEEMGNRQSAPIRLKRQKLAKLY
jgi:hypothetical protein